MAADTSIGVSGLADTIQLVHLQRKSGTLTVVDGARRVTVSFRNGMVVACEDPEHPIQEVGDILVRGKKLTAAQLREIQYHQDIAKESLPVAIAKSDYAGSPDIEKAVASHIGEIFMGLFKLKSGTFQFEPKDITPMPGLITPLRTEFLMMEGVRRAEEWPYVQKIVPSLRIVFERTSQVPLGLDQDLPPPATAEDLSDSAESLSPEEIAVYKLVDGIRDVRAIMEEAPLSEFEVCRGLSSLVSAGFIVESVSASPEAQTRAQRFWIPSRFRHIAIAELLPAASLVLIVLMISFNLELQWKGPEGAGQVFRELKAHHAVATVKIAVKAFKLDRGKAPVELGSLVRNGYIDANSLRDPFTGDALAYEVTDQEEDLHSAGPDGKLGTGDDIR